MKFLYTSLLLLLVSGAHAEILKYQDHDGNILFSDRPMKGPYRLIGTVNLDSGSSSSFGGVVSAAGTSAPAFDAEEYRKRVALYTPLINATARLVQLRPELLHALIKAESSYRPSVVSKAGAVGLMQLMPGTAERYGVTNRHDPAANLRAGAYYLRDLLELFDYDMRLAVAAYNAGENAVLDRGNTIPPYPETIEYVRRVMLYYKQNLQPRVASN